MNEIRGIVVPVDGSDVSARALPVVRDLVARTGAEVTIVTSTVDGEGAGDAELDAAEAALGGARVHRVTLDDRGAASAAIDVTLAGEGRVLCLATHGRGGLGRSLLGSVTAAIVRSGDVPVLVVGPRCSPRGLDSPGPVMVCVDGSDRSARAVAAAAEWCRVLDRDVTIRAVVDPLGVAPTPSEVDFAPLRPPLERTGREVTTGILARAAVPEALVDFAETEKCPLMVLAPGAVSRWQRLMIGEVTLQVLRSAPCPVLVVPEGRG